MSDNKNASLSDRAIRAVARDKSGPKGDRLAGYTSPGTLRPGVGKLVQRTGQPQYCGAIVGMAMAVEKSPNPRDPSRTSTRFIGDFIAIAHDGKVQQVGEAFFPSTLTRIVAAGLAHSGPGVAVGVDFWCEPDPEGRPPSPLGYSYAAYNRRVRDRNDPVLALAVATGHIEASALEADTPLLTANEEQVNPDDVDPDTGEVIERSGPVPTMRTSDVSDVRAGENASQSVKSASGKVAGKRA